LLSSFPFEARGDARRELEAEDRLGEGRPYADGGPVMAGGAATAS
jgi:hypothetical protein